MRIINLSVPMVFALAMLACQPQTLDRSSLLGTVTTSDTADASPDTTGGDTQPSDTTTSDAPAEADGADTVDAAGDAGTDAVSADTAPSCSKDSDCPAKACQKASCTADKGCVYANATDGSPCDDGDKCTMGDTCQAGACEAGATNLCECKSDSDCEAKSNVCTGPLVCDKSTAAYKCKATGPATQCPDADPSDCMVSYCDPAATKLSEACKEKPLPDKTACSDGIACTLKDACKGGQCVFGTNTCECLDDQTCQDKFGAAGDKCTGTWYCNIDNTCKKTAATVCDTSSDTPCVVTSCDKTTGKCAPTPVKKTPIPCDDGNGCTTGDVCEKTPAGVFTGQCVSSDNTCGCASNADCAAKEDGNKCNGTLFCNKLTGACEINPATVVSCPTALDTACVKHWCNQESGICETVALEDYKKTCEVNKPESCKYVLLAEGETKTQVLCDDGDPCTAVSSCKNGQCASGTSICVCKEDSDCAAKDDGNLCNGTLYCNKVSGACEVNPATVVVCATVGDTPCAHNLCNPKTGQCEQKAQATLSSFVPCEDGNLCTKFDSCGSDGSCHSGTNTCVCSDDTDCASKEDGNLCNGTLYCNKATGACEVNPATKVYCSPQFDNQCRTNVCAPDTGTCSMKISGKNILCDDGNPCTVSDVCKDGECSAGPNICSCNAQADCDKLEDGNLCNGTLYCDLAAIPHACKVNPATAITCPTALNTSCLVNTCDKTTGKCSMQPPPQLFAGCDDGNPCTAGDVCVGMQCVPGANTCGCTTELECANYDDGNPCNGSMSCINKICAVNPATVVLCENVDICSKNVCKVAVDKSTSCAPTPVIGACDDKNPCTKDSCTNNECAHEAIDDPGVPCSIGALVKVCVKGVCTLKL